MAHRQIASELEICRFYDPLVVDADEELTEEENIELIKEEAEEEKYRSTY
jgi:hypothetical protein